MTHKEQNKDIKVITEVVKTEWEIKKLGSGYFKGGSGTGSTDGRTRYKMKSRRPVLP